MGRRISFNQASRDHGLAGVIGFYGSFATPASSRASRKASTASIGMLMIVYDGAPHSFFDRRFEEHREACDDAWRRMLAFVGGV